MKVILSSDWLEAGTLSWTGHRIIGGGGSYKQTRHFTIALSGNFLA